MLSWRGLVDTIHLPGIGRLVLLGFLSILAFAGPGGDALPLPPPRMRLGCTGGRVRVRGPGPPDAIVQGGLIRRLVPRVRRVPADRRGDLASSPRLRRHGHGHEPAGACGGDHPGGGRPGAAPGLRSAACSRGSRPERAGGRLRHALLGADAGADDQLFRRQRAAGPGLRRRALLVRASASTWSAGLAAVRFLSHLGGDFPRDREPAQATEAQAVAAHGAAESAGHGPPYPAGRSRSRKPPMVSGSV